MKKLTLGVALLLFAIAIGPASAQTNLTVTNSAAIGASNFGLSINFDGVGQNAFLQDDSPNAETTYRASFSIRDATTSMTNGTAHILFRGRTPGVPAVFLVQYFKSFAGPIILWCVAFDDNGNITTPIMDFVTQNRFTFEWKAASAPGANDGEFRLYKGANLVGEQTNIDNDTYVIDFVQIGAFGGVDNTTFGEVHVDDFESFRTHLP